MQFVRVSFPDPRAVFIDDGPDGQTDEVLRVEEGPHKFDLGDPQDYTPPSQVVSPFGTSREQPCVVSFEKCEERVPDSMVASVGVEQPSKPASAEQSSETAVRVRARKRVKASALGDNVVLSKTRKKVRRGSGRTLGPTKR
jgi:hypothetical protein